MTHLTYQWIVPLKIYASLLEYIDALAFQQQGFLSAFRVGKERRMTGTTQATKTSVESHFFWIPNPPPFSLACFPSCPCLTDSPQNQFPDY